MLELSMGRIVVCYALLQRQSIPTHIVLPAIGLEEGMIVNQGIREPAGGEAWPIEQIDLVVVPALAYDRSGNRLGRGGGFYDRFLAQPALRAVRCGLAFSKQVVQELPVGPNDHPVDLLVTDAEVLRFRPRPTDRQGDDAPNPPGKRPTGKEIGP